MLLGNVVRAPRGPEASGKRSPSGRVVFCADSEVFDDGKLEIGRGAVLPPEVTDQNQPVGEVSPACGSRRPALCPLQTRSPYHVPFGTAAVLRRPDPGPQRNPEKRWSPVRRREGIRIFRRVCGFHSYPAARSLVVRAEGAWLGRLEVGLRRVGGRWGEECPGRTGRDPEGRRLCQIRCFLSGEAAPESASDACFSSEELPAFRRKNGAPRPLHGSCSSSSCSVSISRVPGMQGSQR